MERWRFFLTADKRLDLTDTFRGRHWAIHSLPKMTPMPDGSVAWIGDDGPFMAARARLWWMPEGVSPEERKQWEASVRSVRSVAKRVKGFRGRPPGIEPKHADRVMDRYLHFLRPRLIDVKSPRRAAERIRLLPDEPADDTFDAKASYFFALVFGSFLNGFADPVCQECGRELRPTAQGRINRAVHCPRCRDRIYRQSIPAHIRKKQEREKKARQRAAAKEFDPNQKGKP
jgi:hypothetical protein